MVFISFAHSGGKGQNKLHILWYLYSDLLPCTERLVETEVIASFPVAILNSVLNAKKFNAVVIKAI